MSRRGCYILLDSVVGGMIAEASCRCCRWLYDNAAGEDGYLRITIWTWTASVTFTRCVCVCGPPLGSPVLFFPFPSIPCHLPSVDPPPPPPPSSSSPSSSTLFLLLIIAPQKRTETHYPHTRFYERQVESFWNSYSLFFLSNRNFE